MDLCSEKINIGDHRWHLFVLCEHKSHQFFFNCIQISSTLLVHDSSNQNSPFGLRKRESNYLTFKSCIAQNKSGRHQLLMIFTSNGSILHHFYNLLLIKNPSLMNELGQVQTISIWDYELLDALRLSMNTQAKNCQHQGNQYSKSHHSSKKNSLKHHSVQGNDALQMTDPGTWKSWGR